MSVFEKINSGIAGQIHAKVSVIETVKTGLAEAKAAYDDATGKAADAAAIANIPAMSLYNGMTAKLFTAKEVTSLLIDVFGAKVTSSGKVSKTPAGHGEAIRKRVIRAVQIDDYINGRTDDVPACILGADIGDVAAILNGMNEGRFSIWTAYDAFADAKPKGEGTPLMMNATKLSELVTALLEPGAFDIIDADGGLLSVYAGLHKTLCLMDECLAAKYEKKAPGALEKAA